MKLGAISDTHDNLAAIAAAIRRFSEVGVEAIVHAGDFCAPFALKPLLQTRLPLYAVFGNCDGERAGLTALLPELAEGPRPFELGGRKVCVGHVWERFPREMVHASDILVFGHTHEPKVEHREGRLIVNPGEAGGWLSGRCTIAVIDTDTMTADVETVYEQARTDHA